MIERLYPGVFLTEIPFNAKPIDGVSVSTPHAHAADIAAHAAHLPSEPTPQWTQANPHDPGVTLLGLFAWLDQSLVYRAQSSPIDHVRQAQPGSGVVGGLAVAGRAANETPDVKVSPGLAVGPDGRRLGVESARAQLWAPKP